MPGTSSDSAFAAADYAKWSRVMQGDDCKLQTHAPWHFVILIPGVCQLGSMPVFLIKGAAAGDDKNLMSALAASGSFALAGTPAANTVIS